DGGLVSSIYGYVGDSDPWSGGGRGTASVSGAGSTWTSNQLTLGSGGQGALTISGGVNVRSSSSVVGGYYNSLDGAMTTGIGAVTVTGEGSRWVNQSSLLLGQGGEGQLTVADGGAVSAGALLLGNAGSSYAYDPDTESWVPSPSGAGTGELTIRDGGWVSGSNGALGSSAGSHGAVTVEGEGATWANSGVLYLGMSGTGELTIRDGGTVNSGAGTFWVGVGSSGNGSVTVDGADSTLTTSQYQLSRGTLILRNGAQMISSGGVTSLVGQIDGTMTVEGADTRWITSNGYLIVGANSSTSSSGSGTLNILDGGIVDASGASSTAIGGYRPLLPDGSGFLEPTHGTGVMNVSGSGSGLLASALHVGSIGIGTLNIADGGKVNSHGEGHAGSYAY